MSPQELSLDCEALEELRVTLDTAMVKITLEKHTDQYGKQYCLMKIEPETSMKIGASGKVKCQTKNGICLKYAEDGTPIIGERQMEVDEFIRGKAEESAWSA